MDATTTVLLLLVALGLGGAAGWFVRASRDAAALARVTAEASALREERDRQFDLYRDALAHARADQSAGNERSEQQQQQQHSAVLTVLAPVRESLQQLQSKIALLEQERHTQFGTVTEQLRQAQQSDEALRAVTASLAGALRSTSTRGVWGETQLRRVVEASGLTRHVDFDLQSTISSDRGTGRPDMVIRLAGGASIAVDAKVPLDAFLRASSLPDDQRERHDELLQRHAKAVRAHIDALAQKAYWSGLPASPEFVICFLPSEALLSTAMDSDPTLLDYAFGKKVALASPVNLWAVLKTVAYTWTQHEVSTEAQTLLRLGTRLYERIGTLAGHASDLRRSLERTVDSYNRFAGSLESRVLVTAREFPGIAADAADARALPLEARPRPFTAPELLEQASTADLGDVRARAADGRAGGAAVTTVRPRTAPS